MYGDIIKLTEAQLAPGRTGLTVGLIIPQEMNDVVRIDVDGIKVVWRFGKHLINGIKFCGQLEMYLGDNPGSFNSNAVVLFEKVKGAHPRATDKELAAMIGLPYGAWNKILECEALAAKKRAWIYLCLLTCQKKKVSPVKMLKRICLQKS